MSSIEKNNLEIISILETEDKWIQGMKKNNNKNTALLFTLVIFIEGLGTAHVITRISGLEEAVISMPVKQALVQS